MKFDEKTTKFTKDEYDLLIEAIKDALNDDWKLGSTLKDVIIDET